MAPNAPTQTQTQSQSQSQTQTQAFSGSMTPAGNDRLEGGRSPSETSTPVVAGDSRPAESHWESIIDRATD